jgi:hypothetical protein
MAIKAGQILHVANQFVVDRLQTAGPGDLNIPTEKINELGNVKSVATVRNQPDLTFTLDALDVSTEIEAILCGKNGDGQTADTAADLPAKTADPFSVDGTGGTKYQLEKYYPVDIVSPLKSSMSSFVSVHGVAVPGLALESASYRYGLTDNAGETFSLRTDSIFYVPGHPYVQTFTATNGQTAFPFTTGNVTGGALAYTVQGTDVFAYSVTLIKTTLGTAKRMLVGIDYTDDDAGVTMTTLGASQIAAGDLVRIVYGGSVERTYAQSVHQGVAVKPAAIKGKDIRVYIGTYLSDPDAAGPINIGDPFFWTGVQSCNVDWRVTLDDDYEFGNPRLVARDFADVPAVTGSIDIKPVDMDDLFTKIKQVAGVTDANKVVGPNSSVALPLMIQLLNPESGGVPPGTAIPGAPGAETFDYGTVLKTLYVPDARFTIPGYQGQVQQKLVQTLNWESDTGTLEVFRGMRS